MRLSKLESLLVCFTICTTLLLMVDACPAGCNCDVPKREGGDSSELLGDARAGRREVVCRGTDGVKLTSPISPEDIPDDTIKL